MADQKHTPCPWHRRIGRRGNGQVASQHEQVCNAEGVAVVMLEHDGSLEGEANIVRIIACVNACAGIEDPTTLRAELDAAKERIEYLHEHLRDNEDAYAENVEAFRQRDVALTGLRIIADKNDMDFDGEGYIPRTADGLRGIARAALRKATGESHE